MAESFLKQFNDPLGIREKSSRPETFEQTVEGEGEDDVAALQARSFSGREGLARSYGEERRLIGKQEGLERNIYRDTANLVAYRNEQELFKARQQELAAKADSENITKMIDEIRSSPLYKQKEETNKQIAEYSAFVPTEVTAPMLGVLFATIGAAGMLLGGNNKNTAKAALSAMNGMAEGFGKGREQYDKERKTAFDTNVKLLQTKLSAINDGLEDARKEAVLNKQAAELKVRETLASNDAQFLQENTNRRGLESTIELVKGQLKSLEKALGLQQTKTRQIEGQLNRDAQALENRKISAAHAEVLAKDARQARAQEAADRREFELEQLSKRQGAIGQPIATKGNQAFFVDQNGNIVTVELPAGSVPVGKLQPRPEPRPRVETPRVGVQDGGLVQYSPSALPTANVAAPILSQSAGAKAGQGEKAPADVEKNIKQNVIIAENMRSTVSLAEDLAKKGKLKNFGIVEGRIPYDIIQQYSTPEELEFIAQMNSLTNQQLKLQSGATVTASEFARQRGVLPLVTDRPETVIIKLKAWQRLIDTETKVLGRAYPETLKKYMGEGPDFLAKRMDQAGATPGGSEADERSQAQSAILKIQNSTLDPKEKEKRVKSIESSYKERTKRDL
jgi:hypothetical protein